MLRRISEWCIIVLLATGWSPAAWGKPKLTKPPRVKIQINPAGLNSPDAMEGNGQPLNPPSPGALDGAPISVFLSETDIELFETPEMGLYQSRQWIGVDARSWLPQWHITCVAQPPKGLDGFDVLVQPAFDRVRLGSRLNSGPVSALEPVQLGVGIQNPEGEPLHVNEFLVMVKCDPLTPEGEYSGIIDIIGGEPGRKPVPLAQLRYRFRCVSFVRVELGPAEGLVFGSLIPGDHLSSNVAILGVLTNKRNVTIHIAMTDLRHTGGKHVYISGKNLALGLGDDGNTAMKNARQASFGLNEATLAISRPGRHEFFIAGKAKITTEMQAGDYRGSLTATVSPNG